MVNKVIILDCETTGLVEPMPVEIAYFKVDDCTLNKESRISDNFALECLSNVGYFLQRFKPTKPIDPGASKVNGIYMKDLIDKPCITTFKFPSETEYMIGHNIGFDHRALGKPDVKLICTKELAQLVITGQKNNKLVTLIEHLYPEYSEELLKTAHTALQDCKLTYLVLLKCLEQLPQIETWEQLSKLCSQGKKSYKELDKVKPKVTVTVMPFGTHKGKLLTEIPKSYLQWMLNNMDNIQPDLREAIVKLI
jgi:exodeoxyribonuclease X